MGLPLAVLVFTLWWLAINPNEKLPEPAQKGKSSAKKKRLEQKAPEAMQGALNAEVSRMIAAGIIAGLLPLAHAHSFVVVMGMGPA